MSIYKCISNFGKDAANTPSNNPLTYCLNQTVDNTFMHGAIADTISSAHGKNCQAFMSQYCANKWDNVCEYASQNTSTNHPSHERNCLRGHIPRTMTAGEILIQNTAMRKYLVQILGSNCNVKYEPFDPTVASSPMIAFWNNEGCVPVYEVNPDEIDDDPVMNKILAKPYIAWSVLVNIYNTAKRTGKLKELEGTKIHQFFHTPNFQHYIKNLK